MFFVRGAERRQFNEFLTAQMNDAFKPAGPKAIRIAIPADGWKIEVNGNAPIPFKSIVIEFDVDEEKHTVEITSQRIAELILSGFGAKRHHDLW